jgi:hypothetical protein
MKISLPFSLIFSFAVLLGLNSANATIVQSALAPNKIGISVDQLMATTAGNVALPTAGNRPAEMANASKGIHLGTNTDLFRIGFLTDEYWVRYTLDTTSQNLHTYTSWDENGEVQISESTPLTGHLWLSLDLANQQFAMHDDLLSQSIFYDDGYNNEGMFSPIANKGDLRALKGDGSGYPDYYSSPNSNTYFGVSGACIECDHNATLNLAFLELSWNGTGYDLFTTSQGFDQVFTNTGRGFGYDNEQYSTFLNIAPVPIPAAAWLMSSALIGLIGISRRRK